MVVVEQQQVAGRWRCPCDGPVLHSILVHDCIVGTRSPARPPPLSTSIAARCQKGLPDSNGQQVFLVRSHSKSLLQDPSTDRSSNKPQILRHRLKPIVNAANPGSPKPPYPAALYPSALHLVTRKNPPRPGRITKIPSEHAEPNPPNSRLLRLRFRFSVQGRRLIRLSSVIPKMAGYRPLTLQSLACRP